VKPLKKETTVITGLEDNFTNTAIILEVSEGSSFTKGTEIMLNIGTCKIFKHDDIEYFVVNEHNILGVINENN